MSINLPLKDMTLQEKLAVMESIWEDLGVEQIETSLTTIADSAIHQDGSTRKV